MAFTTLDKSPDSLISRLLQRGDDSASLVSDMGRLGDGTTPCSIVGAVADVLSKIATDAR